MNVPARAAALLCAFLAVSACGGGGDNGSDPEPPPPPDIDVVVSPARDTLTVGTTVQLTAAVTGSSNTGVTWSVTGGGAVSASGMFTAGATPGSSLVIATSTADAGSKDTATIVSVAAPTAVLTVPDSAIKGAVGLTAGVPAASGMSYLWTVTGGAITQGQGTREVTVTADEGSSVGWSLVIRNLADSAVTVSGQTVLVAGPAIVSFAASRDTVTNGESSTLIGVFTGGTGAVAGVGSLTSGVSVPVGPFTTPYLETSYALTVTGFRGATATAEARVVPVNPPQINLLTSAGRRLPVGLKGILMADWRHDPGVTAALLPGIGLLTSGLVETPTLSTIGTQVYTLEVRSPADSIVRDTVGITVVTPASGQFQSQSNSRYRFDHTATLLADGRVLIAGGQFPGNSDLNRYAEVYNPATNAFDPVDSLPAPRVLHIATRLADGRVFIVSDGTSVFFNPTTGGWQAGPAVPLFARFAVTLSDGRVLLMASAGAAYLFDPVAGTFTETGTPIGQIVNSTALSIGGGRVIITAGLEFGYAEFAHTQIYDVATGQFTNTGEMHQPRLGGTYVALADGRVLAAGGRSLGGVFADSGEVYNPGSGTWSMVGELATEVWRAQGTQLSDGRVLLVGGQDRAPRQAFAQIFDPIAGTFTPLGEDRTGRIFGGVLTPLSNGRALYTGAQPQNAPSLFAELFVP